MTFEAVLRNRLEDPIDFTVANGIGIEKGAVLELLDARVASGAATSGAPIAGIAAREKIASDGRTQLAVYRRGIFDMVASGAIGVGQAVASNGTVANCVQAATASNSGASIIGTALETASNAETFQVYVNIGAGAV